MSHEISLAVWDLPSPVVLGCRATLKAGISCPHGCSLANTTIEIRDASGASLGTGRTGREPLRGTMALYWTEIEVAAADADGECTWTVRATPVESGHDALSGSIRVLATRTPEHRVTIDVLEQGSGRPLADVELRIGAFRATTGESGRVLVDVPRGTYEVHAWKLGYDLFSTTASVAADTTLRLEVALTPQREQPYWM